MYGCSLAVEVDFTLVIDTGFDDFGKSLRTRERADNSKATPPSTTSFFSSPLLDAGFVKEGITDDRLDEGPGVVPIDVEGVVVCEVDFEELATLNPGRTYLFALYPGFT